MNCFDALLKLSGDFYKLAALNFLSIEERDNYFDEDYFDELARKGEETKININKCVDCLYKLRPRLSLCARDVDIISNIDFQPTEAKVELKSSIMYYFEAIDKIINLNIHDDFVWPTPSPIERAVHEKFNINKIPFSRISQLLKDIDFRLDKLYINEGTEKENIINWYIHSIPKIIRLSLLLKQLLIFFDIRDFNQYFGQIIPDLKDLLAHVKSYYEYEKPKQELDKINRDEFDKWIQEKISDAQLAGEYGKDDLGWDDLDEEDKLALLEGYNLK